MSTTKAQDSSYQELSKTDTGMARTIAAQTQRLRQLQVSGTDGALELV
jgi:hypothetical protein